MKDVKFPEASGQKPIVPQMPDNLHWKAATILQLYIG
jgi:hypothetical protein